jgi:TolB-like protein
MEANTDGQSMRKEFSLPDEPSIAMLLLVSMNGDPMQDQTNDG